MPCRDGFQRARAAAYIRQQATGVIADVNRKLGMTGLFLLLCPLADAQTPARPSYALVIGNAAYRAFPALPVCDASANLATAALGRAGFTVTKLRNPSNAQFGQALLALGDTVAAAAGARAVVYVCGYTTAFADRTFLLPVEAAIERPPDVLTQGIVARLLANSAIPPHEGAGLVLIDTATPPGQPAVPSFATLLRADELVRGGLAAAEIPGSAIAGPIAAALPDLLRPPVEVGRFLHSLEARPEFARPGLLAVQLPTSPTLLLDGPDTPAESVAAATPPPEPAARPRAARPTRARR